MKKEKNNELQRTTRNRSNDHTLDFDSCHCIHLYLLLATLVKQKNDKVREIYTRTSKTKIKVKAICLKERSVKKCCSL